jgi:hypothetical protein
MKKFLFLLVILAVTLISAQSQAGTVALTWTQITDSNVTKVNLYSTTAAGCASLIPKTPAVAPWVFLNNVPAPANIYTITGLAAGTYCFYATSANSVDESGPSNVVSGRIPLPVPVLSAVIQ